MPDWPARPSHLRHRPLRSKILDWGGRPGRSALRRLASVIVIVEQDQVLPPSVPLGAAFVGSRQEAKPCQILFLSILSVTCQNCGLRSALPRVGTNHHSYVRKSSLPCGNKSILRLV